MIIWLNGTFGSGKTSVTKELNSIIKNSYIYDPENVGFLIRDNIPDIENMTIKQIANYIIKTCSL